VATKVLPIVLPSKQYEQLQRLARAEERDPIQQARYIIKTVLEATKPGNVIPSAGDGPAAA
jgi:hypothetical protein